MIGDAPFLVHGYCIRWSWPLLILYGIGDLGITLAYCLIPFALMRAARPELNIQVMFPRVRALGFNGYRVKHPASLILGAFALFIFSCGQTHLWGYLTFFLPIYWLDALVRVFTALVSLTTAAVLGCTRIAPGLSEGVS